MYSGKGNVIDPKLIVIGLSPGETLQTLRTRRKMLDRYLSVHEILPKDIYFTLLYKESLTRSQMAGSSSYWVKILLDELATFKKTEILFLNPLVEKIVKSYVRKQVKIDEVIRHEGILARGLARIKRFFSWR